MVNKELTKELYASPIKERNEEKYGHFSNQCICCGKGMKEADIDTYVHMNENWKAVNMEIVNNENIKELTGAESQGAFPIGKTCAKKMKGFTYTL
tara:strand:+ start:722 stop:1006 length:285 start_codon:yes stop_codon:yes gene_type:complete